MRPRPIVACASALMSIAPMLFQVDEARAEEEVGLTLELGLLSAYVYRGVNVFQTAGQLDLHPLATPAISWNVGSTGLTLGYVSFFQVGGDGIGANIDAGAGAEQDLSVSYTRAVGERAELEAGLGLYLYPLASREVSGTSVPAYVEPSVSASYAAGVADLGLWVSYFHGLQDALRLSRYLYLNPTVARTFAVAGFPVTTTGGFGYKLFVHRGEVNSNRVDFLVAADVSIPAGRLTVRPTVAAAWTDLEGESLGGEIVVFGGVNLGAGL